ncbi:MAG: hypothetical protein ACI4PQ_08525 [Butyricicoccaceae bacterium]
MKLPIVLFGIFLFAVVTAVLVVWGMRKSYFQRETLTKMLLSKSADRVMRYLKTHDTITEAQMRKLVAGIQASEFHSRQRATVQADRAFTSQLIQAMLHDGLIEPAQAGRQIYRKKTK